MRHHRGYGTHPLWVWRDGTTRSLEISEGTVGKNWPWLARTKLGNRDCRRTATIWTTTATRRRGKEKEMERRQTAPPDDNTVRVPNMGPGDLCAMKACVHASAHHAFTVLTFWALVAYLAINLWLRGYGYQSKDTLQSKTRSFSL